MPPSVWVHLAQKSSSTRMWKSTGRSPMWQPPRSGMKASPRLWSSGPAKRIGMREDPARAVHLHGILGQLNLAGSDREVAVLLIVVNLHPVQPQQVRDDVDVANQRNVAQHGCVRGEECSNHDAGPEVLRAVQ